MILPVIDSCTTPACGACCVIHTVPFQLGEFIHPEAASMIDGTPAGEYGECPALDVQTRRCTIYEHRPAICRDFERGGRLCHDVRREYASWLQQPFRSPTP